MASHIEDYALIGDTETAALVATSGSIDWFCAPRFDSAACFAGLLGGVDNGRWLVCPAGRSEVVGRRYRGDTLVLETIFATATGEVAVIDFMPVRGLTMPLVHGDAPSLDDDHPTDGGSRHVIDGPSIVRIVEGRSGTVSMHTDIAVRFDYGGIVPWVRAHDGQDGHEGLGGFIAIAGADALVLHTEVDLQPDDMRHIATFDVAEGERVAFSLAWFPSHRHSPDAFDTDATLDVTERWWQQWADRCTYEGPWRNEVRRSLVTLKGLTYAPTGGIVAAATTSLPEWIGGVRNWDYRYCWLRDATFTLTALVDAGHADEAVAWSDWLRRAVAGSPDLMQIMYGVGGERRLEEYEVPWLEGYEGSAPVRVGNAASGQFQLDVFGEVMDMFLVAASRELSHLHHGSGRTGGLPDDAIDLARFLVDHVADVWTEPDDGIWEVRGPRRHFVHSKVMAWVAIDRWVKLIDVLGLDDDPTPWQQLATEIHADVCAHGYDATVGAYTQHYGSTNLDASGLMLGLVGFLAPDDPQLIGTIEAIQRDLMRNGFLLRYATDAPAPHVDDGTISASPAVGVDGLPPGEGAFLLTTFWLVDSLVLIGRVDEAREIFERMLLLTNDVGLLAEEYDPVAGRMLGNIPQAFSHVGLVNAAFNLADAMEGGAGRVVARGGDAPKRLDR